MDVDALGRAALALAVDVVAAALILILGSLVAGWAGRAVRRATERSVRFDRTLAHVAARAVRWSILAFTILAVLNRFGLQTTSLVAVLGAAGLAVGLALQGSLSNVAAGVMILGLRPFRLGDAVEIGGTAGSVEDIGLFSTRLKTFDGVVVHQPNSNIWGSEIKNYSQAELRRADLVVGIGYRDDIGRALQVAEELLAADERVLAEPESLVAVESLGADSVNVLIRFWAAPADFWAAKLDLTRRVKERFDEEGIEIPFQQRDLHLIQDGPVEVRSIT